MVTSFTRAESELIACDIKGPAHEALFYVLPFLGLRDLLAVEQVCRSLRNAVEGDPLLWKSLVLRPPLSFNFCDENLRKYIGRGQGMTEEILLDSCRKVTSKGLQWLWCSKRLKKVYLPRCRNVEATAIVKFAIAYAEGDNDRKYPPQLRLFGTYQTGKIPLDDFASLGKILEDGVKAKKAELDLNDTDVSPLEGSKQRGGIGMSHLEGVFVHIHGEQVEGKDWLADDPRLIDLAVCPSCDKVSQVFDCPKGRCRRVIAEDVRLFRQLGEVAVCRGCLRCVRRCVQCGTCVDSLMGEGAAMCGCHVCDICRDTLPECAQCGHYCCMGHLEQEAFLRSSEKLFLCNMCGEEDWVSYEST